MDIHEVIHIIRKKPGMFIGCEELTPLFHFLNGCRFILNSQNSHKKSILPLDFGYFSQYVSARMGTWDNRSWQYHILNLCNGDEKKALSKFFQLYDDFADLKITHYEHALLNQDNKNCNDHMEHGYRMAGLTKKQPLYHNPVSAYILELSIPAFLAAVETADKIECDIQLYKSSKRAKGALSAAFGKIDSWNQSYGKPAFENKDIYLS